MFDLIVRRFDRCGRNPTGRAYVAALESVGEFETGAGGERQLQRPSATTPSTRSNASNGRRGCECWVQVSDYEAVAEAAG